MATVETIIGEALELLGHDAPTGASSGWTEKYALMALRTWPTVRDDVTARHPWSFACAKSLLTTPAVPVPAWGFGKQFLPPAGFLRLLQVGTDEWKPDYQYENGYIQIDADECPIRYIRQLTDTTFWRAWFVELMVYALAARLAYKITNSTTLAETMQTMYLQKLHIATALDENENQSEQIGDFPLIEARFRGI